MVCIFCGHDTKVANSRHQKRPNHVWRRRKCLNCGRIFTTTEAAVLDNAINYLTSSQTRVSNTDRAALKPQPFVQEILFLSLYNSLRHRPTALSDASSLCQTIVGKLLPLVKDGSLLRDDVVSTTSAVLKRFDRAAAISYLAFHPPTKF